MQKRSSKKKLPRDYMSAEELKSQLFERFREIGAIDGLQAQLRDKLASEMLKASVQKQSDKDINFYVSLLPFQVSNWLVYDHLKRQSFEYSLSTFMGESKLSNPENLLSIVDVLHMFGYDDHSSEYSELYNDYIKNRHGSFLMTFLTFIVKNIEKKNSSNVEHISPTHQASKVSQVESFHSKKVFGDIFHNQLEPNLNPVGNKTTGELQHQLQLEREKHKNEVQSLRQKLIKEIEGLQEQGQQARFEIEEAKSKLLMEKEMLDVKAEKLKWKEAEVQKKAENLEEEMKEKEKLFQNVSHTDKMQEVKSWEIRLKEQQEWLEQEIAKIRAGGHESEQLKTQLQHLEKSYKSLQNEYDSALHENENLKVKLKNMADYSMIKEELSWKSKKLNSCEIEIMLLKSEMQAEKMASLDSIQKLQQQLMFTAPKRVDNVRSELDFAYRVNSGNFSSGGIDANFAEMRQHYQAVLQRFEEQKGDIRELHKLMHSFQNQISECKQNQQQTVVNPVTTNSAISTSNNQEANTTARIKDSPVVTFTEKPLKLITEAKRRIDSLEKESEALEQRYSEIFSTVWVPPVPMNKERFHEPSINFGAMTHRIPNLYQYITPIDSYSDDSTTNSYLQKVKDFELSDNLDVSFYPMVDSFLSIKKDHIHKIPTQLHHADNENKVLPEPTHEFPNFRKETTLSTHVTVDPATKQSVSAIENNPLPERIEISSITTNVSPNTRNEPVHPVKFIDRESTSTDEHSNIRHESLYLGIVNDTTKVNKVLEPITENSAEGTTLKSKVVILPTFFNQTKSTNEDISSVGEQMISDDRSIDISAVDPQTTPPLSANSPFRRRRSFNFSLIQGAPSVNLNKAWQQSKCSIDENQVDDAPLAVTCNENVGVVNELSEPVEEILKETDETVGILLGEINRNTDIIHKSERTEISFEFKLADSVDNQINVDINDETKEHCNESDSEKDGETSIAEEHSDLNLSVGSSQEQSEDDNKKNSW